MSPMASLSHAYKRVRDFSRKTKVSEANEQHINPQTQSPFFARLPPEIREQIYQLALQMEGAVGLYTVSPSPGSPIRLITRKGPGHGGISGEIHTPGPLSLLRSCRRIDDEAVHILYSTNTFQVPTPVALKWLAQSRGGPWLRSLRFSWALNEPPPQRHQEGRLVRPQHSLPYVISADEWDSVWATLAELSHLKHLHVEIMALDRCMDEWSRRERELLQPLQGILSPGTCAHLGLTWPPGDMSEAESIEEMLGGWTITRHYHLGPSFITIGPTVGGRSVDQIGRDDSANTG